MQEKKTYLPASDIPFEPVGDRELAIISKQRNRILFDNFVRRTIISVIVVAAVMIIEYIGRINSDRGKTVTGAFIFIIAAGIIYNILSYGYMHLKRNIDMYRDHLSFVYGCVTEKYDRYRLSKENHQESQNYILFETEKYHCTTAIPVKNANEYRNIAIGSSVLVVKVSPYGSEKFELYTDLKKGL